MASQETPHQLSVEEMMLYHYGERLAEATDKSQNLSDYLAIMEAARGSVKAKKLVAQLIPKYFKYFPDLSSRAFDQHANLCKDEDLEVRVQAILGLPLICEDNPKYISKLVDVLGQLPPEGEYVEREAVQTSLMIILGQVVKDFKMHEEDLFDVPPSIVNPADYGKNVDISLTSQLKIGVIDLGCSEALTPRDLKIFKRPPVAKSYHSCEAPASISAHGLSCASVISGISRNVKFFDVCDKEICGVVPDAQLYTYSFGCGKCKPTMKLVVDAIEAAIQDGVKVISMSIGPSINVTCPQNDVIGMKLLEASDKVLACVPSGNSGPLGGTAVHGLPWGLTVGGCTRGEILNTDVEIAIPTKEKIPSDLVILDTLEDRGGDFFIIERIKGISLNVISSGFRKLRLLDGSEGKECILYGTDSLRHINLAAVHPKFKSLIVSPVVSTHFWASISKEDTDKLFSWDAVFRGQLFVRILESRYQKDERGFLVADFSSRGPSRAYPNNITPDLVAPGYAVLTSHRSTVELNQKERKDDSSIKKLMEDHNIVNGTSFACPLVAAYALVVCAHHPDWKPSAIKSALITTASSFAARGIPGNEFVFGAGAVDLERALNPGLVYEESELNFRRYFDGKIEIFDLNLATFAAEFSHTYQCCEKKFARKLKNVGSDDVTYKFEIKFFNKSSSDNVTITADPDQLIFKPGEIKEFVLKVKIYPRPYASVSALVKWVPTSGKRCCVSSPLLLYHHSEFDRKVDYVKDTK